MGDRQNNREHGENVVFASYEVESIVGGVETQLEHGRYSSDSLFGKGDAGVRIAESLAQADLHTEKSLTY